MRLHIDGISGRLTKKLYHDWSIQNNSERHRNRTQKILPQTDFIIINSAWKLSFLTHWLWKKKSQRISKSLRLIQLPRAIHAKLPSTLYWPNKHHATVQSGHRKAAITSIHVPANPRNKKSIYAIDSHAGSHVKRLSLYGPKSVQLTTTNNHFCAFLSITKLY